MALYRTCKRMIERGQTAGMEKQLILLTPPPS